MQEVWLQENVPEYWRSYYHIVFDIIYEKHNHLWYGAVALHKGDIQICSINLIKFIGLDWFRNKQKKWEDFEWIFQTFPHMNC